MASPLSVLIDIIIVITRLELLLRTSCLTGYHTLFEQICIKNECSLCIKVN